MTNDSSFVQVKSAFIWLLYTLTTLWVAVSIAWSVYAHFDYGYGYWYKQLDIAEHIQRYAPQHPDKRGFEQLPAAQHRQAFAQIRRAVHASGQGLETINYPGPEGDPVDLLDDAEVTHLQDVAHLLDLGFVAFFVIATCWAGLGWLLIKSGLPPWRWRVGMVSVNIAGVVALLALIGPKQIFYALHVWVFPKEHQWFFYWEASLMSTLMKAPELFAGIALVIAAAAIILSVIFYRSGVMAAGFLIRR